MSDQVVLDVLGTPAPKGSSRAIVSKRTGRAHLVPSGSNVNRDKLRSWDRAVRGEATRMLGGGPPRFVEVCLRVQLCFRIARPAGHWGTGRRSGRLRPTAPPAPRTKPDIDKLARTTLDALIGSVIDDDSRIVELSVVKEWAEPGREGAMIMVEEWRRS